MRKNKIITILFSACLILVFTTATFLTACAKPEPTPAPTPTPAPAPAPAPKPEPIVLKAVTFQIPTSTTHHMFIEWVNKVNEAANGKIVIDVTGGPEVISSPDQPEALKSNVIQLNDNAATRYKSIIPEAAVCGLGGPAFDIVKWRESGFDDAMRELFKAQGFYYFGSVRHGDGFFFWVKEPIKKPQELKGLRFRSGVLYDNPMKALGISPVFMEQSEVYTALERGVIDGFGDAATSVIIYKYHEINKYRIAHNFLYPTLVTLTNLETWNKIPKDMQDLMQNLFNETQPEAIAYYDKIIDDTNQQLKDFGVQDIVFSPEDAKSYLDTINNTFISSFLKDNPENGQRLLDYMGK